MQLVDFNHAMLRAIYCFYLCIFSSIVLLAGLLLIPLGYFVVIIIRLRIFMREMRVGKKKEGMLYSWSSSKIETRLIRLLSFIFTGPM